MRLPELNNLIDEIEFPTTSADIIATYGDRQVSLADGDETVATVFSRCSPETFATPEDARLTLYSALSDEAIGRKGYSDRDPPQLSEGDPISF